MDFLKRLTQGMGMGKSEPESCWRTPVVLDRGCLGDTGLALDRRGRGSAVWENGGRVWTMPIGPRSSPSLVRLPVGEGRAPRIELNLGGRGIALWQTDAAGERCIQGKILGDGEGQSHTVFRTEGQIRHLQAAVDRRGNALMVWLLELEGRIEVMAGAFDARGQAWNQEPMTLGIPTLADVAPRIAVNHREHAMVLWESSDDAFEGLVASHYWPSDRIWSDRPVPVVSHATRHHQVAMDGSGNALALWVHAPYGQRWALEASYYDALAAEWREPEVLSHAQSFSIPRLVMSETGEALAAWCQGEGHGPSRLFAKAFAKGAWESGLEAFELGHGPVRDFAIGLGPAGQAGLLAVHHGAEGDWVSARLRQREWSAPVPLSPASRQPCASPRLSLCPGGASAMWIQGQGAEQTLHLAETR
ncbi:hypothetical protein GETHLI_08830 [Geothrix limicola]|uniref:Uncharacterized protein n=1 Tax=Geothrix limicola TaxID=2927978 RepID=A0ABQ5QD79_9BACT|nr:hypothetical protein [Geothrix limicola]GLH72381.1 hypothetical protein GETHLI_08830 [Geothrix limicola]